jgi:hypothetical protein
VSINMSEYFIIQANCLVWRYLNYYGLIVNLESFQEPCLMCYNLVTLKYPSVAVLIAHLIAFAKNFITVTQKDESESKI